MQVAAVDSENQLAVSFWKRGKSFHQQRNNQEANTQMNEQLQQALAAILTKTLNGIDAGAAFLSAELPDVIQQLLIWKLCANIMGATIAAVMVIFYLKFLRSLGKIWSQKEDSWMLDGRNDLSLPGFFAVTFCGFIAAVFFIIFLVDLFEAVQIVLAPKIYLIEYAADLAKKVG